MTRIHWRLGAEIELLAPPGKSRLDLATAIAQTHDAEVERFFHPQSEPSLVPGTPIFHNLTLGYKIQHPHHGWIASCVDDLTLQSDLNREASPQTGWYRIISDDERLLRLVQRQADARQPVENVLEPIARLFGTTPSTGPGGMVRVDDLLEASIAIAAPLPGERERPCELVTAPLEDQHQAQLEQLLGLARSLGFTAPIEGATHLHFDATRLQNAPAFANLVQLLWTHGDLLKGLVGTNSHCRRLGSWPNALMETVTRSSFRSLQWSEARAELQALKLSKFCDFNLANCIHGHPTKNTVEIRILPVHLESGPLLVVAALFAAILERSTEKPLPFSAAPSYDLEALLENLPLSQAQRSYWRALRAPPPRAPTLPARAHSSVTT